MIGSNQISRPRKLCRLVVRVLVIVLLAVTGLELIARQGLGLGDPPLSMTDPEIEYLFQPSKSYRRFGNRVRFNQWSMRSEDFPKQKSNPREFRVIVLGDSVVNGGAKTTQGDLATEIIKRELTESLKRPVEVGNVSAGSWGPPNLLAYVKRFGLFDADAVVLVLSSHDAADVPTFRPLTADAPQHAPTLALQELAQRYLPRYLPGLFGKDPAAPPRTAEQEAKDRETSLEALRELIGIIQQSGARFAILQHMEKTELTGQAQPGFADIAQAASDGGVQTISAKERFAAAIAAGDDPYRDSIHPNVAGQRLLADIILQWLRSGDS